VEGAFQRRQRSRFTAKAPKLSIETAAGKLTSMAAIIVQPFAGGRYAKYHAP
jgi:hypothetical protein